MVAIHKVEVNPDKEMAGSRTTRSVNTREAALAAVGVVLSTTSRPNTTPHNGEVNINTNTLQQPNLILPPPRARTIQSLLLQIPSPIPI